MNRKTLEKRRLREERRAQGLCYQCGKVHVKNGKQCNTCLLKQRATQRRYYNRHRGNAQKLPPPEKEEISDAVCVHQWELNSHTGHWSNGICSKCGSKKQFANSLTDEELNTWGDYYLAKVQD